MYTKGEWKAKKNALGTWTIHTELEHIGQIDRHFNAHLIAAAPDMYEALKEIKKYVLSLDAMGPETSQVIAGKCYLAIAKVEK